MKTTTTVASTTSLEVQQATTALNIENIKADIAEIKQSIKELGGVYVTQREFNDMKLAYDIELARLNRRSALWAWLGPTLSAIFASAVTFLIVEYFIKVK